jgi:hypothetical protein
MNWLTLAALPDCVWYVLVLGLAIIVHEAFWGRR